MVSSRRGNFIGITSGGMTIFTWLLSLNFNKLKAFKRYSIIRVVLDLNFYKFVIHR